MVCQSCVITTGCSLSSPFGQMDVQLKDSMERPFVFINVAMTADGKGAVNEVRWA